MTTAGAVVVALAIALGILSAIAFLASVVVRRRTVQTGREELDAALFEAIVRLGVVPEAAGGLLDERREARDMLRERVGPRELEAVGGELRRRIAEVPLVPALLDGRGGLVSASRARLLLALLETTRQAGRPWPPVR